MNIRSQSLNSRVTIADTDINGKVIVFQKDQGSSVAYAKPFPKSKVSGVMNKYRSLKTRALHS